MAKKFNEIFEKFIYKIRKASKEIEQEKEKEINLIENNKNKIIEENNKKYENLIEYFESIKNDREKIIEFFNSNNLFEFNN